MVIAVCVIIGLVVVAFVALVVDAIWRDEPYAQHRNDRHKP
jgi:hypothetical protein